MIKVQPFINLLLSVTFMSGCFPIATPIPATAIPTLLPPTETAVAASAIPTSTATATEVPPTPTELPPTETATPPPAGYPPPLGEHAVFTYLFYWYDTQTGAHLGPHAASTSVVPLTDEPPDNPPITWRGTEWFRRQIEDMVYAGIDVMLPVYWTGKGELKWSRPGIENLAKALEEERLAGVTPPAVAMFFDTNSIGKKDLTVQSNQEKVYEDISFFYKTIPLIYWARTSDLRPIIWFWIAKPLGDYDSSFFQTITRKFQEEFGETPYLVVGNDFPQNYSSGTTLIGYDALYKWNGSYPNQTTDKIASISPGLDTRFILSRSVTKLIDRRNGDFYREGWIRAIECHTPWVVVETWNEFHEGTDIAESKQFGRHYLDITHELSRYFKAGGIPTSSIFSTKYKKAASVSINLSKKIVEKGLSISKPGEDGKYQTVTEDGKTGRRMNYTGDSGFLYFHVDNGFYYNQPQEISITVTYFDQGTTPIYLEYDTAGCTSNGTTRVPYKHFTLALRRNSMKWKTVTAVVKDATFMGHQNNGADFSLAVFSDEPALINKVVITKAK